MAAVQEFVVRATKTPPQIDGARIGNPNGMFTRRSASVVTRRTGWSALLDGCSLHG